MTDVNEILGKVENSYWPGDIGYLDSDYSDWNFLKKINIQYIKIILLIIYEINMVKKLK